VLICLNSPEDKYILHSNRNHTTSYSHLSNLWHGKGKIFQYLNIWSGIYHCFAVMKCGKEWILSAITSCVQQIESQILIIQIFMDHDNLKLKPKSISLIHFSDHWMFSNLLVMDDSLVDSFSSTFCQIFTPMRAKSATRLCYSTFNLLYEIYSLGKGKKHYLVQHYIASSKEKHVSHFHCKKLHCLFLQSLLSFPVFRRIK